MTADGICTCAVCGTKFKYGDHMSPMLKSDVWSAVVKYHKLDKLFDARSTGCFVCFKCMTKALGRRPGMDDLMRAHDRGTVVPFNGPYIADTLVPETFDKFINIKLYTDIMSYGVWAINEEFGTAHAIQVRKEIVPRWIPGGFSSICVNNDDFQKVDIVIPQEDDLPHTIVRNKGVWGWWEDDIVSCQPASCFKDVKQILKDNPTARLVKDLNGDKVIWYNWTKSGRIRKKFVKLGKTLDTVCRYYYDFNY